MNLHCPDATLYCPNIGSEDKGRICWLNSMSIMSIILMFRPEGDLRLAFNIETKPGFSLFDMEGNRVHNSYMRCSISIMLWWFFYVPTF